MTLKIGDYHMPDPDAVGQSEYRALYDLLESVADGGSASTSTVADHGEAVAVLEEVKSWCDSLIDKLLHVHRS
jgi:hypothetical protein